MGRILTDISAVVARLDELATDISDPERISATDAMEEMAGEWLELRQLLIDRRRNTLPARLTKALPRRAVQR